jgi:hypothetical protein
MKKILRRLRENELRDKQEWLRLIKFYNSEIDKYSALHSFYYKMKEDAVNEVVACDIQIQFLDYELKEGE